MAVTVQQATHNCTSLPAWTQGRPFLPQVVVEGRLEDEFAAPSSSGGISRVLITRITALDDEGSSAQLS